MRAVAVLFALAATLSSVASRPYVTGEERQRLRERRRFRVRRAGASAPADAGQTLVTGRNVQCAAPTTASGALEATNLNYPGSGAYLTCYYAQGTCLYNSGDTAPDAAASQSFCGNAVSQASGGDITFTRCPTVFGGVSGNFLSDNSNANIYTSSNTNNGPAVLSCTYQQNAQTQISCQYSLLEANQGALVSVATNSGVLTLQQGIAAGCATQSVSTNDPSMQLTTYTY